jgi:hypothetical protein
MQKQKLLQAKEDTKQIFTSKQELCVSVTAITTETGPLSYRRNFCGSDFGWVVEFMHALPGVWHLPVIVVARRIDSPSDVLIYKRRRRSNQELENQTSDFHSVHTDSLLLIRSCIVFRFSCMQWRASQRAVQNRFLIFVEKIFEYMVLFSFYIS